MTPDPEELEKLVSKVLRDQPLRRAPASLQNRVLARLEARSAAAMHTGWGRGFTHWPLAARIAFLVISMGFVAASVQFVRLGQLSAGSVSSIVGSRDVVGAVGPAGTWVHAVAVMAEAISSLGGWVAKTVPGEWLYGAAGLAVMLYAMLFGLGTVAYRALYVNK